MSIVAGAALIDKNDNVIIVLEKKWGKKKSKWGFPKGHREATDKCDFDCMVREVKEEIGLDIAKIDYQITHTCYLNSCIIYMIKLKINLIETNLVIDEKEISSINILSLDELYEEYELMPHMFNRSVKTIFQ